MKLKHIAIFAPLKILMLTASCVSTASNQSEVKELRFGPPDFQVEVTKHTMTSGSAKTLIILPPTGGSNYLDRSYAKSFLKTGYDVIIIERWTGMLEEATDLELHQRLYTRAQQAIKIVLVEIKTSYIGLLGTSVGALHAAVAAGSQDQIDAIFIIAGGAPITQVIVHSDHKDMVKLKKSRKQRYGFANDTEYLQALDKAFHLEPLKLDLKLNSKALGVAIAENDTTVPTAEQMKLIEFWKPGTVIRYDNNHFWGIVKTWLFEDDAIIEFFEKNKT